MAPIRTFDVPWPVGPPRTVTVALGTTAPNTWFLVRPSQGEDEYDPREWCSIATQASDEPFPAPSASGNPIFALKNYSENKGILERLEGVGMIRHTGRRIPQGFVQLEMVEVLVPKEELIKGCGTCGHWEEVGEPRYLMCSKCKMKYYCSKDCQKEDWKEHKKVCKIGMTEEEAFLAEKAKTEAYLKDMGFQTMNM